MLQLGGHAEPRCDGGDIPGLAEGVNRLARALAMNLFVAGAANVLPALALHDDRELEPTRYFLQR